MGKSAHVVLYENIKQQMARRHLSTADIAHRTGLPVSTIRHILDAPPNSESIGLDKLARFAAAFSVSPAELLAEGGAAEPISMPGARPPTRFADATPKLLGKLIEEFFVLPDADRRALLTTASDMASKYRAQVLR